MLGASRAFELLRPKPGSFSGLTNTTLDTEAGTTSSYIDNLTWVSGRHTLKCGAKHHARAAEQLGKPLDERQCQLRQHGRLHR
jgi:hypothetical protein